MMSLRDKDGPSYSTKQEEQGGGEESKKANTTGGASSSSRQWSSGLKNPRIVRVSRTFGGKDRHSKVCTIKGLRDRRIRLSVPTAIQLYDLQDRLGLSQPSKVIDWLLDTTKHDIDKLPPLPLIPGPAFSHSQGYGFPYGPSSTTTPFFDSATMLPSSRRHQGGAAAGAAGGAAGGAGGGININTSIAATQDVDVDVDVDVDEDHEDESSLVAKWRFWNNASDVLMRAKQKGIDDHNQDQDQGTTTSQVLAQNLFPIASNNSNTTNNNILPHPHPHPSFLSNNPMFNYYHLEPSHLSLTQLGSLGLPSSQDDDQQQQQHHHHHHQSNSTTQQQQPPSSLSLSSMSQLFLCPSMANTSMFPPHQQAPSFLNTTQQHHPSNQVENDLRHQFNRFPLSNNNNNNSNNPFSLSFPNSSGLDMKPFPLSMNHDPNLQQGSHDGHRQGKSGGSHGHWKDSSGN